MGALEQKGFDKLTPVQEAVLSPELLGRDLRISSQTGSGKTVAIGFAIRAAIRATSEEPVGGNDKGKDQRAQPHALVVTPTRELAKQVEEELAWLYAPLGAKVTSVTGGTGYRDELRSFRAKPAIVVGTPGRLLDHLKRGAVDASAAAAIVLDEADRMLDMGFREDLEAILAFFPKEHRTHLVSATFPREVRALADRIQVNPAQVEGTPLGTANLDIEHLLHLVHPRERLAAIINLLLEQVDAQTLIFARTRADVSELSSALMDEGFTIAMLSGEMEQAERNRALAAFKRGNVDALVATDVAARGIDVNDVTRVLHAEPPTDADAYTHRSGRTGRAGKKGISSVLVTLSELPRTTGLLGRARVRFRFAPIPSAETIREARDQSLLEMLTADFVEGEVVDERSVGLAEKIIASSEPARAVARLVGITLRRAQAEPREVTVITPPSGDRMRTNDRYGREDRGGRFGNDRFGNDRPQSFQSERPQGDRYAKRDDRGQNDGGREPAPRGGEEWVAFRVSWGESHGATAPRLVAMMCRRGNVEGRDLGAIRVGRTSSVVEVSRRLADDFESATSKPDPRDPRVHVRRWSEEPVKAPTRREAASEEPATLREDRVPAERPSAAKIPKERASVAKIPKDRPSVTNEKAVPADRPSKRAAAKTPTPTRDAPRPPYTPSKGGPPRRGGPPPWASGGNRPPKRRP